MSEFKIHVAGDYSATPLGRYRRQGEFSGQRFREDFLIPALENNEKIIVNFDGVAGLPSSFLEEAFGGLVRTGTISSVDFFKRVLIEVTNPALELVRKRIRRYVENAKVRS